jgi:hypothetical protein
MRRAAVDAHDGGGLARDVCAEGVVLHELMTARVPSTVEIAVLQRAPGHGHASQRTLGSIQRGDDDVDVDVDERDDANDDDDDDAARAAPATTGTHTTKDNNNGGDDEDDDSGTATALAAASGQRAHNATAMRRSKSTSTLVSRLSHLSKGEVAAEFASEGLTLAPSVPPATPVARAAALMVNLYYFYCTRLFT